LIAREVSRELTQQRLSVEQFRAELLDLAGLPVEESSALAELVLQDLSSTCLPVAPGLTSYLTHLPGVIARRRPLLGPGNLSPDPEHLERLLPRRVPPLVPGTCLPGLSLRVQYWIGGGGGGDVYRGQYDIAASWHLAIKVPRGLSGPQLVKIEATVLQQLAIRHIRSGIPVFHSCDESSERPALVTRYIPGYTLEEVLLYSSHVEQDLSPPKVVRLLILLARILEPVHNHGLVHRDLKPANILFSPRQAGGYRLFLIDWGLAGPKESLPTEEWGLDRDTMYTAACLLRYGNTPLYASPHQSQGEFCQPADDVYSLGALAIFTLTRELQVPLAQQDWQRQLRALGAEPWFIRLLERCTAAARTRRPATAGVLLDCLQRQRSVH
jgi:hypothetical protein